jgi:hypothetical protein
MPAASAAGRASRARPPSWLVVVAAPAERELLRLRFEEAQVPGSPQLTTRPGVVLPRAIVLASHIQ